ncbi:hypothetical protein KR018_006871 [Drosophila ironensis]|nr:hypothetical protein KR018_006871 [Drosophila ironensis]
MNSSGGSSVLKLVSLISSDPDLNTFYFYNPAKENCLLDQTIFHSTQDLPAFIWRSEKKILLNDFFGDRLLVLACLPKVQWKELLDGLSRNLRYLRQARILIELAVEPDEQFVEQVLEFCLGESMINTDVIFRDFSDTQIVYGFEAYPEFKVVKHTLTDNSKLFSVYPDKMIDLRGAKIRTMVEFSEPNTILYRDKNGNKKILGYLWDMLEAYARKCNGSLQNVEIYVDNKVGIYIEVLDIAQSGVVDVVASIQPMSFRLVNRFRGYTYPIKMDSWCVMLPVERDLYVSEMLMQVVPTPTIVLLCLLWILCFIVHGRWRRHRRLQSVGWMLLVTMIGLNYLGRLLSLLAAPPAVPPINSFQEIIDSNLRILSYKDEFGQIDFTQRTKYSEAFQLTSSISDLIRLRNSMNTSLAYTITNMKWKMFREQQEHSSRPRFRYSKEICFNEIVPFGLVIPENSQHRASLHHFILQIWESGLMELWSDRGFSYMLRAGKMHLQDLRQRHQASKLTIKDFRPVFFVYGGGMSIAVIIFIWEIVINWIQICLGY